MEGAIYNLLTLIIVIAAFAVAGLKFYKSIKPNQKSGCDSGCGGCTSKCDLKQEINQKMNYSG